MFAIYGISGPIFQGTLENLSRLQPVLRRSPPPPVRRVGAEVEGDVLTGKPIPTTTAGINTEAIKSLSVRITAGTGTRPALPCRPDHATASDYGQSQRRRSARLARSR